MAKGFVKVSLVVGEYIVSNTPEAIAEAKADLVTDLDSLVREWNIDDHVEICSCVVHLAEEESDDD